MTPALLFLQHAIDGLGEFALGDQADDAAPRHVAALEDEDAWNAGDAILRRDVLGTPATKETATVGSPIEHRLEKRRADQMPLFSRQNVELINDPHIIALEVLIVADDVP